VGSTAHLGGLEIFELDVEPHWDDTRSLIRHLRVTAGTDELWIKVVPATYEVALGQGQPYIVTRTFYDHLGRLHVFGYTLPNNGGMMAAIRYISAVLRESPGAEGSSEAVVDATAAMLVVRAHAAPAGFPSDWRSPIGNLPKVITLLRRGMYDTEVIAARLAITPHDVHALLREAAAALGRPRSIDKVLGWLVRHEDRDLNWLSPVQRTVAQAVRDGAHSPDAIAAQLGVPAQNVRMTLSRLVDTLARGTSTSEPRWLDYGTTILDLAEAGYADPMLLSEREIEIVQVVVALGRQPDGSILGRNARVSQLEDRVAEHESAHQILADADEPVGSLEEWRSSQGEYAKTNLDESMAEGMVAVRASEFSSWRSYEYAVLYRALMNMPVLTAQDVELFQQAERLGMWYPHLKDPVRLREWVGAGGPNDSFVGFPLAGRDDRVPGLEAVQGHTRDGHVRDGGVTDSVVDAAGFGTENAIRLRAGEELTEDLWSRILGELRRRQWSDPHREGAVQTMITQRLARGDIPAGTALRVEFSDVDPVAGTEGETPRVLLIAEGDADSGGSDEVRMQITWRDRAAGDLSIDPSGADEISRTDPIQPNLPHRYDEDGGDHSDDSSAAVSARRLIVDIGGLSEVQARDHVARVWERVGPETRVIGVMWLADSHAAGEFTAERQRKWGGLPVGSIDAFFEVPEGVLLQKLLGERGFGAVEVEEHQDGAVGLTFHRPGQFLLDGARAVEEGVAAYLRGDPVVLLADLLRRLDHLDRVNDTERARRRGAGLAWDRVPDRRVARLRREVEAYLEINFQLAEAESANGIETDPWTVRRAAAAVFALIPGDVDIDPVVARTLDGAIRLTVRYRGEPIDGIEDALRRAGIVVSVTDSDRGRYHELSCVLRPWLGDDPENVVRTSGAPDLGAQLVSGVPGSGRGTDDPVGQGLPMNPTEDGLSGGADELVDATTDADAVAELEVATDPDGESGAVAQPVTTPAVAAELGAGRPAVRAGIEQARLALISDVDDARIPLEDVFLEGPVRDAAMWLWRRHRVMVDLVGLTVGRDDRRLDEQAALRVLRTIAATYAGIPALLPCQVNNGSLARADHGGTTVAVDETREFARQATTAVIETVAITGLLAGVSGAGLVSLLGLLRLTEVSWQYVRHRAVRSALDGRVESAGASSGRVGRIELDKSLFSATAAQEYAARVAGERVPGGRAVSVFEELKDGVRTGMFRGGGDPPVDVTLRQLGQLAWLSGGDRAAEAIMPALWAVFLENPGYRDAWPTLPGMRFAVWLMRQFSLHALGPRLNTEAGQPVLDPGQLATLFAESFVAVRSKHAVASVGEETVYRVVMAALSPTTDTGTAGAVREIDPADAAEAVGAESAGPKAVAAHDLPDPHDSVYVSAELADWYERVDELIGSGARIVVVRGAGTAGGIDAAAAARCVELLRGRIERITAGGESVVLLFDGGTDNPRKPDVGSVFGGLMDALAGDWQVAAISVQSEWAQAPRLVAYSGYEQIVVGRVDAITAEQLDDLSVKAVYRSGDIGPVRVTLLAALNSEALSDNALTPAARVAVDANEYPRLRFDFLDSAAWHEFAAHDLLDAKIQLALAEYQLSHLAPKDGALFNLTRVHDEMSARLAWLTAELGANSVLSETSDLLGAAFRALRDLYGRQVADRVTPMMPLPDRTRLKAVVAAMPWNSTVLVVEGKRPHLLHNHKSVIVKIDLESGGCEVYLPDEGPPARGFFLDSWGDLVYPDGLDLVTPELATETPSALADTLAAFPEAFDRLMGQGAYARLERWVLDELLPNHPEERGIPQAALVALRAYGCGLFTEPDAVRGTDDPVYLADRQVFEDVLTAGMERMPMYRTTAGWGLDVAESDVPELLAGYTDGVFLPEQAVVGMDAGIPKLGNIQFTVYAARARDLRLFSEPATSRTAVAYPPGIRLQVGKRYDDDGVWRITLRESTAGVAAEVVESRIPPADCIRGRDLLRDLDYRTLSTLDTSDVEAEGDGILGGIYRHQGFDGLPTMVGPGGIDALLAAGGRELFRGVTEPRYVAQFRTGSYFPGRSAYGISSGNGTYVTTSSKVALHYAEERPDGVVRMALRPDARVRDIANIHDEHVLVTSVLKNEIAKLTRIERPTYQVIARIDALRNQLVVLGDLGRFAAAKGYDAYRTYGGYWGEDDEYWVILNRTALVVEDAPLQAPTSHAKLTGGDDRAVTSDQRVLPDGLWQLYNLIAHWRQQAWVVLCDRAMPGSRTDETSPIDEVQTYNRLSAETQFIDQLATDLDETTISSESADDPVTSSQSDSPTATVARLNELAESIAEARSRLRRLTAGPERDSASGELTHLWQEFDAACAPETVGQAYNQCDPLLLRQVKAETGNDHFGILDGVGPRGVTQSAHEDAWSAGLQEFRDRDEVAAMVRDLAESMNVSRRDGVFAVVVTEL
ncbi:hypothetical protein, partial [Nocardia sp. NPDC004604]|uniref:hypothetical protein n=1 Tax=Nocardia sp. NPDC004604 TaxID=3157013 RepID=UPI0033AF0C7D